MNIETREIRPLDELSAEEKASGKWVPIAKKYVAKQPISDEDFARIMRADERRLSRAAKRGEFDAVGKPR